jgi:hypothetical protein
LPGTVAAIRAQYWAVTIDLRPSNR